MLGKIVIWNFLGLYSLYVAYEHLKNLDISGRKSHKNSVNAFKLRIIFKEK